MVQQLRIHLAAPGTWVRSLFWEDPIGHEATKPLRPLDLCSLLLAEELVRGKQGTISFTNSGRMARPWRPPPSPGSTPGRMPGLKPRAEDRQE